MKYLADRTRQNQQNPILSMNIFSKLLKSGVTKLTKLDYDCFTLCKITKLVLVDYKYLAHTVRLMGFFCMHNILMRSHFMAKLEGDTFECASYLDYWSTNPFQLCHLNYLVVIGRASKLNLGAH